MQVKTLALVITVALLAGCSDSVGSRDPAAGIDFHVDAVAPATQDTALLVGTVGDASHLSVVVERAGEVFFEALTDIDGAWSLLVTDLPYGHSQVRLFVESEAGVARANLTLVRLAPVSFEVRYTAYPAHSDFGDAVMLDVDGRISAPAYVDRDVSHPPHATIHDVLVTWSEATGIVVDYEYGNGFGYALTRIDGVGQPLDSALPPYWCYMINGAYAQLGLTLQEVKPGDVVVWEYASCS